MTIAGGAIVLNSVVTASMCECEAEFGMGFESRVPLYREIIDDEHGLGVGETYVFSSCLAVLVLLTRR